MRICLIWFRSPLRGWHCNLLASPLLLLLLLPSLWFGVDFLQWHLLLLPPLQNGAHCGCEGEGCMTIRGSGSSSIRTVEATTRPKDSPSMGSPPIIVYRMEYGWHSPIFAQWFSLTLDPVGSSFSYLFDRRISTAFRLLCATSQIAARARFVERLYL